MTVNNFTLNTNTLTVAQISNQVYLTYDNVAATTPINGWSYNAAATNDAASFAAAQLDSLGRPVDLSLIHPQVWSDGNGNNIVVFRGSYDPQDARTDRDLVNGIVTSSTEPPPALLAAEAYVRSVAENSSGNIIVAGHSLGGTETLFAVDRLTAADPALAARLSGVAFNPAALSTGYLGDRSNTGGVAPTISFVTTGDPAANVTQFMGGVLPGTTAIIGSGPSAQESFVALSNISTSLDAVQPALGPNYNTAAAAYATSNILLYGGVPLSAHGISGIETTFSQYYATVGSTLASSANRTSLFDLLQEPINAAAAVSITSNIEFITDLTRGFGSSSEYTPIPGLTISFNSDATITVANDSGAAAGSFAGGAGGAAADPFASFNVAANAAAVTDTRWTLSPDWTPLTNTTNYANGNRADTTFDSYAANDNSASGSAGCAALAARAVKTNAAALCAQRR